MEARCAQCGTLWRIDTTAVQTAQPYQCNACGHVFTIALEGAPSMQIRHTNGKVYKVKDLATLVRWVGEKRVPRQCMVREDDGEWQEAMAVPEVAEAFAMLDARRSQGPSSPAAVAPQAVAAAAEQSVSMTPEPSPSASDEADPAAEISASAEDEAALEAAAADIDELDLDGDEGSEAADEDALKEALQGNMGEPNQVDDQSSADEPADDEGGDSFEDAFDLLDDMTEEPGDIPDLGDMADDEDDEPPKKKGKLRLVVGVVVIAAAGAYFLSGGGGAADPLKGDDPATKALRGSYEKALEALASGETERMQKAMVDLEPAMCLKGCDFSQCIKDEKGGCSIDKDAAAFAPFFLLADRLWLELNRSDTSLQTHVGELLKILQAKTEAKEAFAAARLGAVADHWNAIQPKADEATNKSAAGIKTVLGAIPQAPDTALLIALKQLDGEAAGPAADMIKAGTANKDKAPDKRLLALAMARQARLGAKASGCGPVGEAYLAAVKAGLPSVRRELALFLATNGDLKGAGLAVGEGAGDDAMLQAALKASQLAPQLTDKALMAKFAAQNKKTLRTRKGKKIVGFLYKQLRRNPGPTKTRGNLLAGIQEMFPNALKELMESAWIEVELGQAAAADAKAAHGAEAMKRFERALAVDANRSDALLGRAAAASLIGKGAAHRADAFAWLLSQPSSDKPLCAAKPAAPAKGDKP